MSLRTSIDKFIFKSYGYSVISLDNVNNIKINSSNVYNYKNVSFLFKTLNKNDTLIISFHGAVKKNSAGLKKVIFRGYDIPESLYDTLCISDALLNVYKHYKVNWYLSTNKHNFKDIYIEIIKSIINIKNYKNIIFTGSSAGAFPAILYASIFNGLAIIGNPILYPENYNVHFNRHKQILESCNDSLLYKEKEIETLLSEKTPKKVIYYQNIKDGHCKTCCYSFMNFINTTDIDISIILFNTDCKDPFKQHGIVFPYNRGLIETINNTISFLN